MVFHGLSTLTTESGIFILFYLINFPTPPPSPRAPHNYNKRQWVGVGVGGLARLLGYSLITRVPATAVHLPALFTLARHARGFTTFALANYVAS